MSFTIGVDLGGTNVRAGLVSHRKLNQDKLIELKAQPIRSQGTAKEVFSDLCAVIDAVMDKKVRGIGLGVPSLVSGETGTILDTTNIPSWKKVPLRKWLEKKYKVPVRIDNDANCFALGEKHFGAGKNVENFVGLIIGTGLGAGIISRGHLHSGVDGGAGEFGLIPYRDSIIEHYASGQFFRKFNADGEKLAIAAADSDPEALSIFKEYGEHLGFAFKIILYALAPERIILGGSVSQSYRFFSDSLARSLSNFAYQSVVDQLDIKISKVKNIAVLGAATLLHDEKP